MEKYNIVWGDYILNKQPLTLAKAKQELQGLKYHEPEIKKAKTMKISELKQIIRKEISAVLNEANDPSDNAVTSVAGNIMTTRKGKKYKVLTTRPKAGSADFYYDTIMKRIEQLDPEDWDVDVDTYKKAMPL